MFHISIVFGTRPEALKLAPIIKELKADPDMFSVDICSTGQHREMLQQVLSEFSLNIDRDLDLMVPNQSLSTLTSLALTSMSKYLAAQQPHAVMVQGDTTTVLASSLAAFYEKIPVVHVEAGLRTNDLTSPFPEEGNRVLVSQLAKLHLAPTEAAVENLRKEGITEGVYNVGNPVLDTLKQTVDRLNNQRTTEYQKKFPFVGRAKHLILATAHRRENWGENLVNICRAIRDIAINRDDVAFVVPVHLNPNVKTTIEENLNNIEGVTLTEPLDYPELIYLMKNSYLILSDSGGIQEEAPSLQKPVLILRDTTERPEAVTLGLNKLIGTNEKNIIAEVNHLIDDPYQYTSMVSDVSPFGDGKSSKKIAKILTEWFRTEQALSFDRRAV